MCRYEDTICAPATSPGTGAIGIVRMSGPRALEICDSAVFLKSGSAASMPGNRIRFCRIIDGDELLDEGLVAVFRAPNSYTGEDCVELYLHSSPYIMERTLECLCKAGARLAEPGEFTRRAFISGKMDLAQAEAVADIIGASSKSEHKVAMCQLRGGYSAALEKLRGQLLELSALLELELDFSEEEVEFADRTKLNAVATAALLECRRLADSFKAGNALRKGIPVAIVGAPNSGKSTLLNALLEDERAIVSDIPGTTRDTIEEILVLDGVKFRLTDTAGLRDSKDRIELMGIDRARRCAESASILLIMRDGTTDCPDSPDSEELLELRQKAESNGAKIIQIWNKSDACGFRSPADAIALSALSGKGLEILKHNLVESARSLGIDGSELIVTNARHANALRLASVALEEVIDALSSGLATDLVAESLRTAISYLGAITGRISSDEVLGEIFRKFCIGK